MLLKIGMEDRSVGGKNQSALLVQLSNGLNGLAPNFVSVLFKVFGMPLGTAKDPEIVKDRPEVMNGIEKGRGNLKGVRGLVGSFKSSPFRGGKATEKIGPPNEGLMAAEKLIGRRVGGRKRGSAREDTVDAVNKYVNKNRISSTVGQVVTDGSHNLTVVQKTGGV